MYNNPVIIWTNDGLVYWGIYASLGRNELKGDKQLLQQYNVPLGHNESG